MTGFNKIRKTKYGLMIYNQNDMFVGQSIENYGEYCEFEVDLFRCFCKQGAVAMDIGANIGAHTLALSRMVGDTGAVIAFEPQTIVFQTLCGNMAINSIENADCLRVIVSDEKGYSRLPIFEYDKKGNFGGVSVMDWEDKGAPVRKITLDDSFSEIQALDFVKVDVEGMESHVINGARGLIEKFEPVLYVENDRVDASEELIKTIWSLKYKAYWHILPLYNPDNFYKSDKNIFSNVSALNMLCVHESKNVILGNVVPVTDSKYHPFKRKRNR